MTKPPAASCSGESRIGAPSPAIEARAAPPSAGAGRAGQGRPRIVRHRTEPSRGSTHQRAAPGPSSGCCVRMNEPPATCGGASAGPARLSVQAVLSRAPSMSRSWRADRAEATQSSRSVRAKV